MTGEPTHGNDAILVWDLPTRVFHWSLVALAVLGWLTGEAEGALFWTHLAAGYGIMGLVVFRLAWGVLGTRHARFTDFVRPWSEVRQHTADILRFSPARSLGHTPPGGWMIVALLAALSLLVATGLFAGDEGEKGPLAHLAGAWLADALGEVHEGLHTLLWGLVAIHVSGVLFVSFLTGDNLIRAMWTGLKESPEGFKDPDRENGVPTGISAPGFLRLALSVLAAIAAVLAVAW